jgi:hypothetical protein
VAKAQAVGDNSTATNSGNARNKAMIKQRAARSLPEAARNSSSPQRTANTVDIPAEPLSFGPVIFRSVSASSINVQISFYEILEWQIGGAAEAYLGPFDQTSSFYGVAIQHMSISTSFDRANQSSRSSVSKGPSIPNAIGPIQ